MNRTPRKAFTLAIVDAGDADEQEMYRRLRAMLKRMLRSFGFRCTDIKETKQPTPEVVVHDHD